MAAGRQLATEHDGGLGLIVTLPGDDEHAAHVLRLAMT
jgi:hypothetical protein